MNYYERVQKSIDYIEENLKLELPLEIVASMAYMSIANFYRLFYAFTGHSVKDYIRRRRLNGASVELLEGCSKIIDISLEYQFESPESFSRAFKREFGNNPTDFRKIGKPIQIFERINLMDNNFLLSPEELEQYPDIKIIRELPPIKVAYYVGRGYNAEYDSQKVLFKWVKDNHLDRKGFRIYGFDNGGIGEVHEYETWFAFNEDISRYQNSQVQFKSFPGGQYAVMSTRLEQIESSWDRFRGWLRNSRYEYGPYQYLEEHLPDNNEEINGKTRMDLYMPIREKTNQQEIQNRPLTFNEPTFISKNPFTVIGLRCDTTPQDNAVNYTVAKLWDRFNKKENRKIRDIDDTSGGYGIFIPFPKCEGEFSYICGFKTKASAQVPEGMVSHLQPEAKYAVFTYVSPTKNSFDLSGMSALYWHIFGKWMPSSEYKYYDKAFVFEYYERSRTMLPFAEIDIYVPITAK
ncbi:MAG: effector binding domain-containing protein [Clostridiaceae bacterium]